MIGHCKRLVLSYILTVLAQHKSPLILLLLSSSFFSLPRPPSAFPAKVSCELFFLRSRDSGRSLDTAFKVLRLQTVPPGLESAPLVRIRNTKVKIGRGTESTFRKASRCQFLKTRGAVSFICLYAIDRILWLKRL